MPDPKEGEPGWKDITEQCKPIVEELLGQATELFGQPTITGVQVRVTDFSEGPRTCFHNGIAYIRIPPGVSADQPVLKRQLAHEIVHVLSETRRTRGWKKASLLILRFTMATSTHHTLSTQTNRNTTRHTRR